MTTTFLLIALIIMAIGLVVEIGIASWNIRRAGRYRRQRDAFENQTSSMREQVEHTLEKFRAMDKYATDISWLLKFLYGRYDKFADIDKEIEEGIKNASQDTPIGELDKKYQDLKRALKLIKVTVRASDKIEGVMTSIATQIHSIMRDLEAEDENCSEDNKENVAESTPSEEKSSTPPEDENKENVQGN